MSVPPTSPPAPPSRMLVWLGDLMRSTRPVLSPQRDESCHDYFLRWSAMRGLRVDWRILYDPDIDPYNPFVCYPILNDTLLGSHAGKAATEAQAKEAACQALVEAKICKVDG